MNNLSDFDFYLPSNLIAKQAIHTRSFSRLLEVKSHDRIIPKFIDRYFFQISDCLKQGDLLVFNNTKVLKARFFGTVNFYNKNINILVERVINSSTILAQIFFKKNIISGTKLCLANAFDVIVGEKFNYFYKLHFPGNCFKLINRYGIVPLPPYIKRNPNIFDEKSYQTIFAKHLGSVAAPTAGLHFDDLVFDKLNEKGIKCATLTLHIGSGTFKSIHYEDLSLHKMHTEQYSLSEDLIKEIYETKKCGNRIIAVGTSSLRALESAAYNAKKLGKYNLEPINAETNIFIRPNYKFHLVDGLITNFHLPKSTLFILVSAFSGNNVIKSAYRYAIESNYRFYSFGDAMILTCAYKSEDSLYKKY